MRYQKLFKIVKYCRKVTSKHSWKQCKHDLTICLLVFKLVKDCTFHSISLCLFFSFIQSNHVEADSIDHFKLAFQWPITFCKQHKVCWRKDDDTKQFCTVVYLSTCKRQSLSHTVKCHNFYNELVHFF